MAGAILLLFVRGDEEQSAPVVRKIALIVSLLVFAETLLLWSRFNPASGDFQFVERHAWIPAFGITTSSASTASACCCSCSPAS